LSIGPYLCSTLPSDHLAETPSRANGFPGSSLAKATVNVSQQGIFAGPTSDAEIRTVGFRESGTLEPFAYTSLIVIEGWERGDGGDVVHENLKGFAPPLHAAVKL
jgi:hypothetical protein